ncbi:uncharacterized protein METZ01_LOCUS256801 [marine metagenome]|uniref:Uncharacterized protein n=1 Tax=marine metagenome TaxID=408172 RepID=A0A382IXT6_9ZZZZ
MDSLYLLKMISETSVGRSFQIEKKNALHFTIKTKKCITFRDTNTV